MYSEQCREVKSYGNPSLAELLVIGHDPLLLRSDTRAEYVFFMDYLERQPPRAAPELRKYNLAKAVIDYIAYLTSSRYGMGTIDKLYFTNLCNHFLPRPREGETVLIPNDTADCGIAEIDRTLQVSSFKLILPMSLQVFYHLVRHGFVPNESPEMREFVQKARPKPSFCIQNSYVPTRKMAFIDVCGNVYYHRQTPVIPTLHVKTWQRLINNARYSDSMGKAVQNIRKVLE